MNDVLGKEVIEGDFVVISLEKWAIGGGRLETGIIQSVCGDKVIVKTLRSVPQSFGENKLVARVLELDSERIVQCSALDIPKPRREQLKSLLGVVQ